MEAARNVMLDIETLSTQPDAVIIAIAAVVMDSESSIEFYRTISLESSLSTGGTMDADVLLWWMHSNQEEARKSVFNGISHPALDEVLTELAVFLRPITADKSTSVWGNGADFDNLILSRAYGRLGIPVPWNFRQNRCFRTLKNLYRDKVPEPVFTGIKHHALADALHQATWLRNILAYVEDTQTQQG